MQKQVFTAGNYVPPASKQLNVNEVFQVQVDDVKNFIEAQDVFDGIKTKGERSQLKRLVTQECKLKTRSVIIMSFLKPKNQLRNSSMSRILSGLLLTFSISTICEAQTATKSTEVKWTGSDWMGQIFGSGGNIKLNDVILPAGQVALGDLAIPGSHDSGTYETNGSASACGSSSWQYIFGALSSITYRGIVAKWAKAQQENVFDQLNAGVRSLDIRPYYQKGDGQLYTCHTLKTASFDSIFRNSGTSTGSFIQKHPKEVIFLKLSHFEYPDGHSKEAYDAFANYLNKNICPKAYSPIKGELENPGRVQLQQMWDSNKNYVVGAGDTGDSVQNSMYSELTKRGVNCLFQTNNAAHLSGGYPANIADQYPRSTQPDERDKALLSVNLWYGEIKNTVTDIRHNSENFLMSDLVKTRGLHETSYIWYYDQDKGMSTGQVTDILAVAGNTLLNVTDRPVNYWATGLYPYAADFIYRLHAQARKSGANVNIVNMDSIGRGRITQDSFIAPLMNINLQLRDTDHSNKDKFQVTTVGTLAGGTPFAQLSWRGNIASMTADGKTGGENVTGLSQQPASLYYVSANKRLFKCNVNAEACNEIDSFQNTPTGVSFNANGHGYTIASKYLYRYQNDQYINRIHTFSDTPLALSYAGDYVYVVTSGKELKRCASDGSDNCSTLHKFEDTPTGVAFDRNGFGYVTVYLGAKGAGGGNLYRFENGKKVSNFKEHFEDKPVALSLTDNAVWIATRNGAIKRCDRNGEACTSVSNLEINDQSRISMSNAVLVKSGN